MSMTKKDYEAIARTIAAQQPQPWRPGGKLGLHGENLRVLLYRIACEIADHAASRDAKFDRLRFYKACGVTDFNHEGVNR